LGLKRNSAVMISSTMPSAKYLLLGIAGHILERKRRNGRLVGQRRRALSLNSTRTHLIGPDWLLNVLYVLNAKVRKGDRQNLAYLIIRRT